MSQTYPSGAQWRKWDLHVHTPASIVQHYGSDTGATWEKYITDLEQLPAEFKVLGINDYIFVDGYERLREAKRQGRLKNIDLLLPVIELRLDKFGGVVKREKDGKYSSSDWTRVNLHIIFDELEPELIRQQFLSAIAPSYRLIPDRDDLKSKWHAVITRKSIEELGAMIIETAPSHMKKDYGTPLEEGFNNLCCTFDGVKKALDNHSLKGRYLLAVGKAEWANIKWSDQSIAEKRNIINDVNLVFTASASPEAYSGARLQLKNAGVNDKLLDCSDAHAFSDSKNKDRIGNCFTWMKADPTFEGLRHALAEFDQRVYVGEAPAKCSLVRQNRTKFISSISIRKNPKSELPEQWFDVQLPVNHDLVAIIGNKGSGKSALADIIALVGNTRTYRHFSFLNEGRFRNRRTKYANHFYAQVSWADGTEERRSLHEDPDQINIERVKYLPQSYLETLCNELATGGSSSFDSELRQIIYSHVQNEDRLGASSLDELLKFKVSALEQERGRIVASLERINSEISEVEKKLPPGFRRSLEQQLGAKQNELEALMSSPITPVEDPTGAEEGSEEGNAASRHLVELEDKLKSIEDEEAQARQKRANSLRSVAVADNILQIIRTFEAEYQQLLNELNPHLNQLDDSLKGSGLVNLRVDLSAVERLRSLHADEAERQLRALQDESPDGLPQRRRAIESEIAATKERLSEQQRLFVAYKAKLAERERVRSELIGDSETVGSITWIEAQLTELDELPAKLQELRNARKKTVIHTHEQIMRIVKEYSYLYKPVQRFLDSTKDLDVSLPLAFNVRIAQVGFEDEFLRRINRQVRGSFAGVEESYRLVRQLLAETDFMDDTSVLSFLDKIDDMLHFDRRENAAGDKKVSVFDQLRKGERLEDLYNFVFGLNYLVPQYSLTFNGQEVSQLSPGERGLLLLVFYLLVDKDNIPLVIDQPEENLDNQTVFRILVKCIKAAKGRRQIIMVTHNPNLAVVCDAEQIIYASCDKAGRRFAYESGAIEAPGIKARVIEVLEGTKPAFQNRSVKYGFVAST